MSTVMLITVGGSHQPIVTAIQTLQPDRVMFLCSDGAKGSKSQVIGEGKPCEVRRGVEVVEKLPNIPTQLGLGDRFQPNRDLVLVENPDDLSECYRKASESLLRLKQELPDAQIVADYTGGTKTMSVALSLAALDYNIPLFLTTNATRQNLIRVEWGQSTERASTSLVMVERTIRQTLPTFLQQYNYSAAIAELKPLLTSMELPSETRRRVRVFQDCCVGFDAWDRFDHAEAWQSLASYLNQSEIKQAALFLKRVMNSREQIDEQFKAIESSKGHGYEIVEDLLLNAERRAVQKRYDDAVGRLYRGLELLAQIRLEQAYSIKTGDVDLLKLPESMRPDYETMRSPNKGKIQLALRDSYDLLSKLPNEALGQLYRERANPIIDVLMIRNNSLFAHGFQPITSNDYQKVSAIIVSFIQAGIATVISPKSKFQPVQFPRTLNI